MQYEEKVGRFTVTVNSDKELSPEQLQSIAQERYNDYGSAMDEDGDYVFDKLLEVPAYRDALINRWELSEGKSKYGNQPDKKWDGDIEDLRDMQEETFEEFNNATNNELLLAKKTALILGMGDEEREANRVLYEAWDKTAVTGEGSRSGWEQAKDIFPAIFTPSALMGGKLIAGPMMKLGARNALKLVLAGGASKLKKKTAMKALASTTARGAAAGAIYAGGFDVAEQTGIAMNLDENREFDVGRAARTTAAGAVLGGAVGGVLPLAGGMIGRKTAKQTEATRVARIRARDKERAEFKAKKESEIIETGIEAEKIVKAELGKVVNVKPPSSGQRVYKNLSDDIKVQAKKLEESGLNRQQAKERANKGVTGGYKLGQLVKVANGNLGLARHAAKLKNSIGDSTDPTPELTANRKRIRQVRQQQKPTNKKRKAAIERAVAQKVGVVKGRHPEALKRAVVQATEEVTRDFDKAAVSETGRLAERNAELIAGRRSANKQAAELEKIEAGYVPKEFALEETRQTFSMIADKTKRSLGWVSPNIKNTDKEWLSVLTPEELAQVKMGKVSPELKQKLDSGPLPPRELYVPQKLDDLAPVTPLEKTFLQNTVGKTNQEIRRKYPWYNDIIVSISSRAERLHGPLALMFQQADRTTTKLSGMLVPLETKLKAVGRLVDKAGLKTDFDLAWHNESWVALRAIYKEATGDSMDSFEKALKKAFKDRQFRKSHKPTTKGYRDSYLPRSVKDYDGLMNYLSKKHDIKATDVYDQALLAVAMKKGVDVENLTQDIKDEVLSALIEKGKKFDVKKFRSGTPHDKKRSITKVNQEMLQFYQSPLDTFSSWNRRTAADVAETEFFRGHAVFAKDGSFSMEDSVGSLVNKMKGVMSADMRELRKLVEARFMNGRQPAGKFMQNFRNAIYLTLLANPLSAMTQLADLPMGLMINGLRDSIQVLLHPGRGPSAEEMHMMHVMADEFSNETKMAHILHKAFKWSGFMAVDELGKNFILKGAYNRLTRLSKTAKGRKELARKHGSKWEGHFDQLINDAANAKDGEATDLMEMFLWQELAGVQPIGPSELPTAWHNHPNGRVLYALRTFTLKQLDYLRKNVAMEWERGNRKEAVGRAALYLSLIPASNLAVHELKNFVKYGETSDPSTIPEKLAWGTLAIAGGDKRVFNSVARGDLGRGLAEAITPPVPFVKSAVKDIAMFMDPSFGRWQDTIKELNSLREFPMIGPVAYHLWGKGKADWEERQRREDLAALKT